MAKWFAKNNVQELYCPDDYLVGVCEVSLKNSDSLPMPEKSFVQESALDNPRQYKIYNSYENVKKISKMRLSSIKILEIFKYFSIEDKEKEDVLYIGMKNQGGHIGDHVLLKDIGPSKDLGRLYCTIVAYGAQKNENSYVDEQYLLKTLYNETVFAMNHQTPGGCFVLRMYDITSKSTIQLVFLLTNMYRKVTLIKPRTSRDYSLERFLVCQDFRGQEQYIKSLEYSDLFNKTKFSIKDNADLISGILLFNNHVKNRIAFAEKKNRLSTKQNTLAIEFCGIFLRDKYIECKHDVKVQDTKGPVLCSYCDTIVIY
jgi:hypothetical protein